MKRIISSLFAFLLIAFSFAFMKVNHQGLDATFGVCKTDPSSIELTLKKDFSFHYQDFSNPNKKIELDGIYEMKNDKIRLTVLGSVVNFHDKWRIKDNGNTVVSRKGLCFYSIRKK